MSVVGKLTEKFHRVGKEDGNLVAQGRGHSSISHADWTAHDNSRYGGSAAI